MAPVAFEAYSVPLIPGSHTPSSGLEDRGMDQPEPSQRTETPMVREIKPTVGEEGDRGLRKALLGLLWGPSGAVSGNRVYIAKGEVSGNENWGELRRDP